ncbi:hypothetical protein IFM89_028510 [Coptis chinensis]|uniref:CCHC-type domain-containing protein n=1 Tax=Coptis chinensis TaxID=261450 RepID=A0A835HPA6_9MAGN|nr:hypothetical protein IFM89_028510 [Coptis chinensis]
MSVMANPLRGEKVYVIHYDGFWGKMISGADVGISAVKYIFGGYLCTICNDVDVLKMWDTIKIERDGKYHIFISLLAIPTSPSIYTTPVSTNKQLTPRQSPRVNPSNHTTPNLTHVTSPLPLSPVGKNSDVGERDVCEESENFRCDWKLKDPVYGKLGLGGYCEEEVTINIESDVEDILSDDILLGKIFFLKMMMYTSPFFSIDSFKKTYAGYVMPIENVEDWKVPDKMVFPPPFESKAGRPKKQRIRAEDEPQAKGPRKKCSKCGVVGHNSRTCKDNMPPKPKRTGISEDCQGEQHGAAPRRTKKGRMSGGETSQQSGVDMIVGETSQQSGANVSMGETSKQPRVPLVIPAPPPLRGTWRGGRRGRENGNRGGRGNSTRGRTATGNRGGGGSVSGVGVDWFNISAPEIPSAPSGITQPPYYDPLTQTQ